MTKPLTPIAFLWRELDTLLSDAKLADLRSRYEAHSRRYNQAAYLKTARYELALYERIVRDGSANQIRRYAPKIERRKAKIAQLQADLGDEIVT